MQINSKSLTSPDIIHQEINSSSCGTMYSACCVTTREFSSDSDYIEMIPRALNRTPEVGRTSEPLVENEGVMEVNPISNNGGRSNRAQFPANNRENTRSRSCLKVCYETSVSMLIIIFLSLVGILLVYLFMKYKHFQNSNFRHGKYKIFYPEEN